MQTTSEENLTDWECYKKWEPLYEAKTKEEKKAAWLKLYDNDLTEEELEILLADE